MNIHCKMIFSSVHVNRAPRTSRPGLVLVSTCRELTRTVILRLGVLVTRMMRTRASRQGSDGSSFVCVLVAQRHSACLLYCLLVVVADAAAAAI